MLKLPHSREQHHKEALQHSHGSRCTHPVCLLMVPKAFEHPFKFHEHHHTLCRVIDVLPKQWGRALAADYLQQLCDKEDFHQTFLTTLEEIDVMRVLDPEALR